MKSLRTQRKHFRARTLRSGAAVVELAVLLPMLALLFVIAIDAGRMFYFSLTVQNCARSGALYASDPHVANESPFAGVQEAALADAPNLDPPPTIQLTNSVDAVGNAYVEVSAEYTFPTITKFPGIPQEIDLVRTVRMYVAADKPNVN